MGKIPEKLINFAVYNDGAEMLGVADATLPSLEYMTDTVGGAGIAGEVDSPVLGHFKSLTVGIKFRTVTGNVTALAAPKSHHLDLRGSIQVYDSGSGEYTPTSVKLVVKAVPKKAALGKFETGKPQDSENEFEVNYLKLWIDGVEKIEIDKYNYMCVIDGVDYLAAVRANLGK
ncbi:MAG: phage major tail tube protein [Desulfobulbaceae bacterium]|nr:phage major tail tube protein [Desulfobulbaceae bacterium]